MLQNLSIVINLSCEIIIAEIKGKEYVESQINHEIPSLSVKITL